MTPRLVGRKMLEDVLVAALMARHCAGGTEMPSPKLEPYPNLKLDLMTACSLLDEHLTEAEAWEVHVAIEIEEYGEALMQMWRLARARGAAEAVEMLARVEKQTLR